MITVRVTREWNYATSEKCVDTYELEHDENGYNPSTVRDMRDVVMSMMPDADRRRTTSKLATAQTPRTPNVGTMRRWMVHHHHDQHDPADHRETQPQ